jgi:hypothetical protein
VTVVADHDPACRNLATERIDGLRTVDDHHKVIAVPDISWCTAAIRTGGRRASRSGGAGSGTGRRFRSRAQGVKESCGGA